MIATVERVMKAWAITYVNQGRRGRNGPGRLEVWTGRAETAKHAIRDFRADCSGYTVSLLNIERTG
jgi:hypothetical protein